MVEAVTPDTSSEGRKRIRARLEEIEDEIFEEEEYLSLVATEEWDYEMGDAKLRALEHERALLKEILQDL